jgi:four helix bundle protein
MDADMMKARTKRFALQAVRVSQGLPRSSEASVLGKQLLRSATSIAANYRAACRARSTTEFVSKLGVVEEEADETLLWLELLTDAGILHRDKGGELIGECEQILRIVVASIKTARNKRPQSNPKSAIRDPKSREPEV